MGCDSPPRWSACEILKKIADGSVSAREVVNAYIDCIEQVNPSLNAMVVPLFAQARADAAAVDAMRRRGENPGLLAGLPFTAKESFDVAGTPSTVGLTALAQHRAAADAPYVARLRQAGAILLGKTNVSQLLMGNESDNPLYGRTNNPWNPARSPWGSSGGEAALIAAGGSALGLGSDIGGSVRLPAHACGIHAIKPTSRRLTMEGHVPLYPGQEAIVAQPGPMARTVADLELAMSFLMAPQDRITTRVPIAGMRIAMYTDNGVFAVAPALRRAVAEAAAALESRGAYVEEWQPPDPVEAWITFLGILMADGFASAKRMIGRSPVLPYIRLILLCGVFPRWLLSGAASPVLRMLGQQHLARNVRAMGYLSADDYWRLVDWRARFEARFLGALERGRFDAIICPPAALPAVPHRVGAHVPDVLSYSALYNLLGMPAGVVPATRVRQDEETCRKPGSDWVEHKAIQCEKGSTGLPVGVQVAARHWREDIVLSVMHALEEHFRHLPDYPLFPC